MRPAMARFRELHRTDLDRTEQGLAIKAIAEAVIGFPGGDHGVLAMITEPEAR